MVKTVGEAVVLNGSINMDTHLCIHSVQCFHMTLKNVGIRIRVDKELREAFVGACAAENRQASEVLREYMRAYADRHFGGRQTSLFAETSLDIKARR
jgi:hypothetical protein